MPRSVWGNALAQHLREAFVCLDEPAQSNERARMVENQRGRVYQDVGTPKEILRHGKVLSLQSGEALCGKFSGLATLFVSLRLQGGRVEDEQHDERAGSQCR
ncbi:MAG: hypothetical protein WDO74_10065 [Pseudomonadota bacterium]